MRNSSPVTDVKKFTPKERLKELKYFFALCLEVYLSEDGIDLKEICNLTHLSMGTVRKIVNEDISLKMQINTVQKFGAGAGLHLEMTKSGSRLAVLD